jgi:hypothetical protein
MLYIFSTPPIYSGCSKFSSLNDPWNEKQYHQLISTCNKRTLIFIYHLCLSFHYWTKIIKKKSKYRIINNIWIAISYNKLSFKTIKRFKWLMNFENMIIHILKTNQIEFNWLDRLIVFSEGTQFYSIKKLYYKKNKFFSFHISDFLKFITLHKSNSNVNTLI